MNNHLQISILWLINLILSEIYSENFPRKIVICRRRYVCGYTQVVSRGLFVVPKIAKKGGRSPPTTSGSTMGLVWNDFQKKNIELVVEEDGSSEKLQEKYKEEELA